MSRQIEAISSPAGGGHLRLAGRLNRAAAVGRDRDLDRARGRPVADDATLEEVSQRHPVAILPANAPALVADRANDRRRFTKAGTQSIAVVVLTDDKGLSPADETVYRKLVDTLHQDTRDVVMVQDFSRRAPARAPDQQGSEGLDPADRACPATWARRGPSRRTRAVDEIINHTVAGSTLTANLTGPAATVADMNLTGQRDRTRIEVAITILLFVILLIIYRNPITMALPMITIGISLLVAQKRGGNRRPTGPGHRQSDHHFHDRDDGRRGNGLCRLSDQPISRLRAAGRGFG